MVMNLQEAFCVQILLPWIRLNQSSGKELSLADGSFGVERAKLALFLRKTLRHSKLVPEAGVNLAFGE